MAPLTAPAAIQPHGFTLEQSQAMATSNKEVANNQFLNGLFSSFKSQKKDTNVSTLPYAEYSKAGYVIFSEDEDYNSGAAKIKIAKNLPEDMTLVVFTGKSSATHQKMLFDKYAQYIDSKRLKVAFLPTGERGFWARDGVPVPVWQIQPNGSPSFAVVDAKYYHEFEADKEISELFGAGLLRHNYYYEGGNYAANSKGDCIVVDNERVVEMPDSLFAKDYGCKTLTRLPYTKGIGHIDESVKFIDDSTVLVDDADYATTLKGKGFNVVPMIRPGREYETYVNALVVNGTAFVPVFNEKTDIDAITIYEKLGLKVVPLNSVSLSNNGYGSIHCITMSYPPVPYNQLLQHLGAQDIK